MKRNLADLTDNEDGIIEQNTDRKAMEMGLFPGATVTVFRNRKSEKSLVIGVGDSRFLISRAIAAEIEVRRK